MNELKFFQLSTNFVLFDCEMNPIEKPDGVFLSTSFLIGNILEETTTEYFLLVRMGDRSLKVTVPKKLVDYISSEYTEE